MASSVDYDQTGSTLFALQFCQNPYYKILGHTVIRKKNIWHWQKLDLIEDWS